MKVLQICPKPPLPSIDGGCLASYQLSQLLIENDYDVKVISLATEKHPFLEEKINPEYLSKTKFESVSIKSAINPIKAFLSFIKRSNIQKDRFYHSSFRSKIISVMKNDDFDVVIFDGLTTCFYLNDVQSISNAKIIYRSHNLENFIFKQLGEKEGNYFRSRFIYWQAGILEKFEQQIWQKSDSVWSISSFDSVVIKNVLESKTKVHTLPFSIQHTEKQKDPESNTVFHLGAMDWLPNLEGIQWFLSDVWTDVVQEKPNAMLHLGGKDIDKVDLKVPDSNVIIHNEVEDADDFYDAYEIMIVPLNTGSGIRIKIIQALAKGKVIVGTKRGVMGIPALHEEHMMICDSAEEMRDQIISLIDNKELKKKLSRNARKLFDDNFEFQKVSSQLKKIIDTLN